MNKLCMMAIAGVLALLVSGCSSSSEEKTSEPGSAGPQLPGYEAAIEASSFQSLAEAFRYSEVVVVATVPEFQPWFSTEGPFGADFGVAETELQVEKVLKGEIGEPLRFGMPSGEDHSALPALNEAVDERRGIFLLITTREFAERHDIEQLPPEEDEPGRFILVSTQGLLLDGGPEGVYPLFSAEHEMQPFPEDIEGRPFDEIIDELESYTATP